MATPRSGDGAKRALQITIAGLAAIPAVTGVLDIVGGPASLPGGADTTPSVDSAFRFASTLWCAVAPALWSQLKNVDARAPVLDATVGVVFLGGFARLRSWQVTGRPHPVFVGATALELVGMPIVSAWRRRVRHAAGN